MKLHLLSLLSLGIALPALQAQDKPNLEDPKQRVNYIIGADIGESLRAQAVDVDIKSLSAGIVDALAEKVLLTPAQIEETMTKFQREMQGKAEAFAKATAEKNLAESATFLTANKAKTGVKTLASGLQYKVLTTGTGKNPKATDSVKVHYHGTLINGKVFDSSVERKEPVVFPLAGIIDGWKEALQLMKVGDKWQLFIPPALAYGERGRPGIAPNSTLIFDVELLSIEVPPAATMLPPR